MYTCFADPRTGDVDSSGKTDTGAGGDAGGWQADGDQFGGGFSDNNVSKHAGANDGGCRNCGDEGHFARDCPEPRQGGGGGMTGECYKYVSSFIRIFQQKLTPSSCGEIGHNKQDCQNPPVEREFTGECRSCGEVGHRRADCPTAPAQKCRVCDEEGHVAADCTVNRMHAMFKKLGVQDMTAEQAWIAVEAADKDKDVEDIKLVCQTVLVDL